MEVTLRPIREEELPVIQGFFNAEGWNVSMKSLTALYKYQPGANTVALTKEGKIVGNIAAYIVNQKMAFGTGFIVDKAYRRQGIGKQLWQYRWDRLTDITWGVDAAERRLIPNQNLGFSKPEYVVTVYLGKPNLTDRCKSQGYSLLRDVQIKPLKDELFPQLVVYDGKMNHAGERATWLKAWFSIEDSHCLVAVDNTEIVGCGEIHPCDEGFMIGHFYSENKCIAFHIMKNLIQKVGWDQNIGICVPEVNIDANENAKMFGLIESFKCHRMWTKQLSTTLPYQKIYGQPEIAP